MKHWPKTITSIDGFSIREPAYFARRTGLWTGSTSCRCVSRHELHGIYHKFTTALPDLYNLNQHFHARFTFVGRTDSADNRGTVLAIRADLCDIIRAAFCALAETCLPETFMLCSDLICTNVQVALASNDLSMLPSPQLQLEKYSYARLPLVLNPDHADGLSTWFTTGVGLLSISDDQGVWMECKMHGKRFNAVLRLDIH